MRKLLVLLAVPLVIGGASEHDALYAPTPQALVVSGTIDPPLVATLKKKAKAKYYVALELESRGGDGDEGIRLAEFVSRWPRKVVILTNCSSACAFAALVALGQGKLYLGEGATIGVHQAIAKQTGKADVEWTKMVRGILRKYGAPKAPLDLMVATPPDTMTILHEDQLIEWGAAALNPDVSWTRWLFGEADE